MSMANVNTYVVSWAVSLQSVKLAAIICAGNVHKKFPKLPKEMCERFSKVTAAPLSDIDNLVVTYREEKKNKRMRIRS